MACLILSVFMLICLKKKKHKIKDAINNQKENMTHLENELCMLHSNLLCLQTHEEEQCWTCNERTHVLNNESYKLIILTSNAVLQLEECKKMLQKHRDHRYALENQLHEEEVRNDSIGVENT